MTMQYIAQLMKKAGIPDGVFQTVNGTRTTVEALIDHPDVKVHKVWETIRGLGKGLLFLYFPPPM